MKRTRKVRFPSSQLGFTLIELLLAFALLSIIVGALYSTFFLSHKAMEGMDASLVKLQECRNAIDMMSRDVESIFYTGTGKDLVFKLEDRDLYGKQASRFTFSAFSPLMPGLTKISYYLDETEGKLTIFKELSSTAQPGKEDGGVEMIEDVEAFMVEAKDKENWVKTWDASEMKRIPEEIRITLTVLVKEKRLSLFETVRPKIGKSII